jgi:hypothetical protein
MTLLTQQRIGEVFLGLTTLQITLTQITAGTTTTTNGVTAYWEITYEYDDSAFNRIQTISIPLESIQGTLTPTANTAYGTIPQLTGAGGLLNGYNSPTIAHYWAEYRCASGTNASTIAQALNWGFDGAIGLGISDSRNNTLASDTYIFGQIDLSSLSLGASHTLDLWTSKINSFHCISVTINVSFRYIPAGSTRVLNYVEIPVEFESPINGVTIAESHRFSRSLLIPEPGTITQRAIGLELGWNSNAGGTAQLKAGSQASFRAYGVIGGVIATQFTTQHLLDSRSASGTALTLVRGENNIVIDLYRSVGSMTNVSGVLKILYESDISSQGVANHSQTIYSLARQYDNLLTGDNTILDSFQIPSASYWIQAAGLEYSFWIASSAAALMVQCEVGAGEGAGDGWRELYGDQYSGDAEITYGVWRVRARDEFKRYPNDPDTDRLDIETNRRIRTTSSTTFRYGYKWLVTYHNITFELAGNITNSAGGTVNVDVFRVSNNELYRRTSRVGNGAWTINVYDDVEQYYVVAYETDTKNGRSKSGVPATNFDIDLEPTGGGGTTGGRILIS